MVVGGRRRVSRAHPRKVRGTDNPPGPSINQPLLWLLLLICLFVPLPIGSNRAPLWAFSAVLVGLTGTWYFAALSLGGRSPAPRLRQLGVETSLFACLVLAIIGQLLPISSLLPASNSQAGVPVLPTPSLAPGATWLMLMQVCGYGLFGFLTMQVGRRRDRATVGVAWLFSFVVVYGALGLLMLTQLGDTWFGVEKQAYPGSATGPFINRNSFATFLAFGLAMGCALFAETLSPQRRALSWMAPVVVAAATVLCAVALLATNSRMGVVAGAFGGLLALALGGLKLGWGRGRWTLLTAISASAILGLGTYYGGGVLERVLDADGDLRARLELYRQVLGMIEARPWLGIGGGAFSEVYPIIHAPPVSSEFVWDRAHSTYLSLWAELGIVGGTLVILLLLVMGWRALRAFQKSEHNWAAGLAAVATLTVAGLHSTVDFSLEIQANTYYLVAVLGLGAAGDL